MAVHGVGTPLTQAPSALELSMHCDRQYDAM
jgi:hypothetical protein